MIGFLANLRDMKSALTSGMLVLFGLWLTLANVIADVQPGQSIAGNVSRLVTYLGPVGTLGAILFVAYFVGLVLSTGTLWNELIAIPKFLRTYAELKKIHADTARVTRWLTNQWHRDPSRLSNATAERLERYVREIITPSYNHPRFGSLGSLSGDADLPPMLEAVRKRMQDLEQQSVEDRDPLQSVQFAMIQVMSTIFKDLGFIAIQLAAKRESAYNRFDKARSEADFRSSLVLPMIFISVVLAVRLFVEGKPILCVASLFVAAFACEVLRKKADYKTIEANEEIVNAIILGDVQVELLERYRELSQPPSAPVTAKE